MSRIREGSLVRLRGRKTTARVRAMLTDIQGGVLLDGYLGGFRYWNVLDLEVVPRKERKNARRKA